MSEKRNVPKLRFPEFSGEWSCSSLGDNTSWKSGGTPSKDVEEYWNGDIPWISASSMIGTKFSDSELKVTEIGSKNGTRIAPKGSLLLLVRGSMLFNKIPVGIAQRDVTFNQDVKAISPNNSTNSDFLLQWFLKSQKNLLGIVGGTGIGAGKLDTKELQSLTFIFPSLPEQQKIAAFLTSVDQRIELLQAKKEKLEAYKKGVMQKIFSQTLRFKADDGSDFPDWEERKLGEIGSVYQPKTISQSDLTEEGYDVFGANGIIGKYHSYNHEQPQVAVTCRGNTCGTVNWTTPKSWITGNAMVVNTDENALVHKRFLFYSLVISDLKYLITGSGQPQITGDLKNHKIQLPSLNEQKKIVQFLTSLDSTIENLNQQINHTQTWKKGLLQKMFV